MFAQGQKFPGYLTLWSYVFAYISCMGRHVSAFLRKQYNNNVKLMSGFSKMANMDAEYFGKTEFIQALAPKKYARKRIQQKSSSRNKVRI